MKLRLVTKPDEFAALGNEWDRLYHRSAQRSLFLTHAWFDAAWQWRRRSAQLYFLCCFHGLDLVGALPLVREGGTHSLRNRSLEFLSVPDTQCCDVLVASGEQPAVAAALADELVHRQADWDLLRMNYVSAASVARTTLQRALSDRGLRCAAREVSENPCVALDESWDAYYASRSRRLKKAVNLAANRLARAGRAELHWLEPGAVAPEGVDGLIDQIVEISGQSWKVRTGNSLDNAAPQAFIRRLSRLAYERGHLSVWTLTLDKKPIAMEFQIVADGVVSALRSDFDGRYETLSPGSYLSRHLLEKLFAQGWRRYFMGPGENAYKYRWADGGEPVHSLAVYGSTMRGQMLAAHDLVLKPVARRVRNVLLGLGANANAARDSSLDVGRTDREHDPRV